MVRWKLRTLMAERRISCKEMAESLGVHRNTIQQLKEDYPKMIRLAHLAGICRILNCQPSDLFEMESTLALPVMVSTAPERKSMPTLENVRKS